MNKTQLQQLASECQIATDEMAITLIEQNEIFQTISILQSNCEFNLFWLYQISPGVVLHSDTIKFLSDNINKFNRKITIKEIIKFDWIYQLNDIEDFEDFKLLNK